MLLLDGAHQGAVIERAQALRARGQPVWVVYEDLPYTELTGLDIDPPALAVFSRPLGGVPIAVYRHR